MASPEIDLPLKDNLGQFHPSLDQEKKDDDSSSTINSIHQYPLSTTLDRNSPIKYYYLTFETSLPYPSSTHLSSENGNVTPPPPQPDLSKYTSPFEWPSSRKNFMIWLSCLATLITAYTAGSYSPATTQMAAEWDVSETAILVGITTFCAGFAIAPMVLAPFSEINGRYPVFVGAGILFWLCQVCCAVTRSFAGMIVARIFVGCGSSVFSTMVGGIIADLYHKEGRNTPMALFSGGALIGTGVGPLVSGFIAQNTNWRWVFWVQVITCGLLIIAVTVFFRETRGSILLSRKAGRLNRWMEEREEAGYFGFEMPTTSSPSSTENDIEKETPITEPRTLAQRIRWRVKSDEERESTTKMISISIYRPFHLLFTEPVVFFFSLWVAFAWAVLYLTFGAITLVFETSHDFTLEQANSIFTAMIIGAMLATIISCYQDRLLARYISNKKESAPNSRWTALDLSCPEGRLYFACLESPLLAIGLFWFGWTQFPSIPWILPALAVGCATMGIYSIYLATFNYLADTYHRYASSALAAQSFCRNMLGGVFPLVTIQMFRGLTFQGAASLLGGIAALLTAVPWVLVFYGPRIRAKSRFASEIM